MEKPERAPLVFDNYLSPLNYKKYMMAIPSKKYEGKIFPFNVVKDLDEWEETSRNDITRYIHYAVMTGFDYYKSIESVNSDIEFIKGSVKKDSALFDTYEDYINEVDEVLKLLNTRVYMGGEKFLDSDKNKSVLDRMFIREDELNSLDGDSFVELIIDVFTAMRHIYLQKFEIVSGDERIHFEAYLLKNDELSTEDNDWINAMFERLSKCFAYVHCLLSKKFLELYQVYEVSCTSKIVYFEKHNHIN